jgi:hypothetical protein
MVFGLAAWSLAACAGRPQLSKAPGLADFAITVSSSSDGIELLCVRGCAWTQLTFTSRPDAAPQAVDQFGMTSAAPTTSQSPAGRSSFLFTVQRTADEVRLQGIRGSAWTALTYGCRAGTCRQEIDEYGMASADLR